MYYQIIAAYYKFKRWLIGPMFEAHPVYIKSEPCPIQRHHSILTYRQPNGDLRRIRIMNSRHPFARWLAKENGTEVEPEPKSSGRSYRSLDL